LTSVRHRTKLALSLHVVLPVLIGGGIYTFWRSNRLLVFTWYRWLGLSVWVRSLREQASAAKHLVPGSIMYSLPDALWVYAFTALMWIFWFRQPRSIERMLWIILPVTMAVCAELGQLVRLVPGSFDWIDMLGYLIGFIAASFFMGRLLRQPIISLGGVGNGF
jgi:hypothetical protein